MASHLLRAALALALSLALPSMADAGSPQFPLSPLPRDALKPSLPVLPPPPTLDPRLPEAAPLAPEPARPISPHG